MADDKLQVRLQDVFKLSGVPTYTFVPPDEYARLVVALETNGRGLVIEGPSGVGKTTALEKALNELAMQDNSLFLNARIEEDRAYIEEIATSDDSGIVIIDDFHRLPDGLRQKIADRMKTLADSESEKTKIVIVGISNAGEALIRFARDLTGRIDRIKFGNSSAEKVRLLVESGGAALNCELPVDEIVGASVGSFHIAQLLSHSCCTAYGLTRSSSSKQHVTVPFMTVLERVIDDLSMSFMETAMKFSAGPRFNASGRAPYLHMLKWLSESQDWSIRLEVEVRTHPDLETSVAAILSGDHLSTHIASDAEITNLVSYDPRNRLLSIEDPKFFFFLRNLNWGKFAERIGFLSIEVNGKYDFALSFSGEQREQARALSNALRDRDLSVFFDEYEQVAMIGRDLEEYLAPIYRSQATYVVCLLSNSYPERVWTRFEGKQFKARFGTESVIPIYINEVNPTPFDAAQNVGSLKYVSTAPVIPQANDLADILAKKIASLRLRPRVAKGEFYCARCSLVLSSARRAAHRESTCTECAEASRPL